MAPDQIAAFVQLVRVMRAAQRSYFKARPADRPALLGRCKDLEGQVDAALGTDPDAGQGGLFPGDQAGPYRQAR